MKKNNDGEERAGSIGAISSLIDVVIERPAEFLGDEILKASLRSQGKLAKFSDCARGIRASSINTLKRLSNTYLPGGWESLDRRRLSALDALSEEERRSRRSNKTTKNGLQKLIADKQREIDVLRHTNLSLIGVISRLAYDIRQIADQDEAKSRQIRATECVQGIKALLAFNSPPFNTFAAPWDPDHAERR